MSSITHSTFCVPLNENTNQRLLKYLRCWSLSIGHHLEFEYFVQFYILFTFILHENRRTCTIVNCFTKKIKPKPFKTEPFLKICFEVALSFAGSVNTAHFSGMSLKVPLINLENGFMKIYKPYLCVKVKMSIITVNLLFLKNLSNFIFTCSININFKLHANRTINYSFG